jgi:hypothetical protein
MTITTNDFTSQFETLKININGVRLPSFIVEEKYQKKFNIEKSISNFDFLRHLCLIGFNNLNLKK